MEGQLSAEPPPPAAPGRTRQARGLTADIDAVLALAEQSSTAIPLSSLEEMLRGRGAGLLILVLSMPFVVPVPIPLLAAVCGTPMMALGLRMALFRKSRLPRFARKAELSPQALRAVARGLRKVVRPLAWAFRPRLFVSLRGSWWRLIGISVFFAAFLLSLPLPIPFANLIPTVALILFAVGLLQRDGLAVLLGHAVTVGSYAYLYFIWEAAAAAIRGLLHYQFG
jgi:hypothetical protein